MADTETFFGARAAGWEEKFPDDGPRFARAVGELGVRAGDVVLDAGCGTGRALPVLRAAVGATGTVVGVDLTAEMLAEARRLGRAGLVRGDALHLPLRTGSGHAGLPSGPVRPPPHPPR